MTKITAEADIRSTIAEFGMGKLITLLTTDFALTTAESIGGMQSATAITEEGLKLIGAGPKDPASSLVIGLVIVEGVLVYIAQFKAMGWLANMARERGTKRAALPLDNVDIDLRP